jgi:anti-sigma factor RsiW
MTNQEDTARSAIEDLLPWHAAGTLSRREADQVEAALARDPELARRLELVREEMASTIHLNETLGAPSPRAAEKLFAAIDAEPRRAPMRSLNLSARISEFFASLTPRQLAYSAAVGALAIVLQAGLIGAIVIGERGQGGYTTASSDQLAAADGTFALARFAPAASAQAITTFLEANKATVVGGPGPGGLYRLRIGDKGMPQVERDRLIGRLAADTSVVGFVAAAE